MKINNIELKFNYFDADDNRTFRKNIVLVSEKLATIMETNKDDADKLEEICLEVRKCFDNIFYKGAGIKVCGSRYDAKKHIESLESVCADIDKQMNYMLDKISSIKAT